MRMRRHGIHSLPRPGTMLYPTLYLITAKPMAYTIIQGIVMMYVYYETDQPRDYIDRGIRLTVMIRLNAPE